MPKQRRKYEPHTRCEDCGRDRLTTVVFFWANSYRMRVCSDCIQPYRDRILAPCGPRCIHNA